MAPALSSLIVAVLNARVPVFVQLEFPLPEAEEPIREPFVGELYLTFGVDRAIEPEGPPGPGLERVTRRHCAEAGLIPEALRRQAVANLRTRRPDLGFTWYPDARAVAVTLDGDLESSLLLDETFADKLAQDVEGDLVVAVPARDVLIASGTGHPDGLAKLRWVVDQVWAAGGRPLLTRDLLVRRRELWEVLQHP
jgi:hypothetical protein